MMKKKVAIIRGRNLNKWEMQNYIPLQDQFELEAFTSKNSRFDLKEINLPVTRLKCPDELFEKVRGYQRIVKQILPDFPGKQSLIGYSGADRLVGLEEKLNGFHIAHTAEVNNAYTVQAVQAKLAGKVKHVVVTVWENILMRSRLILCTKISQKR